MSALLTEWLPALAGIVGGYVVRHLGLKVPGLGGTKEGETDPPVMAFLDWIVAAKGGVIKPDARDLAALKLIKAALDDIVKP